jgi:hypothetical protein
MTQINHPDYYNSGGIEVADFIDAHKLNFNMGNVIKYVTRAGRKQGEDALIALQKAQWYLNREINRVGQEQNAGLLASPVVIQEEPNEGRTINEWTIFGRHGAICSTSSSNVPREHR